jgi:membrane protease YdiL (CAAX protease family)
MQFVKRFPLLSYFATTYLISWGIAVPFMLAARGVLNVELPHWFERIAAFGPFAAAIIILLLTQGTKGVRMLCTSMVRWRVAPAWLIFAVLSPFLVLLVALAMQGESEHFFSTTVFSSLSGAALFELVVLGGLLQSLGEEPGWRGFALPVLRHRFGPLLATLALFPLWLCWHAPMFLSRPEFTLGSLLGFSLGILAASIWCTFIYDATRSVLMVVIWHALINIARGLALAVSTAAFLALGQVVTVVAIVVIIYWLIKRPACYS